MTTDYAAQVVRAVDLELEDIVGAASRGLASPAEVEAVRVRWRKAHNAAGQGDAAPTTQGTPLVLEVPALPSVLVRALAEAAARAPGGYTLDALRAVDPGLVAAVEAADLAVQDALRGHDEGTATLAALRARLVSWFRAHGEAFKACEHALRASGEPSSKEAS